MAKSLLIFLTGRDVLQTGHAVSLKESFPEKFVKIRQGKRTGFFGWDLSFSTKFYKCGYTMKNSF